MSDINNNCFIVAPIGDADTEIRKRSDQLFRHVFEPASKECGYEAIRSDHISEPGIITSQVIQHLIDDPIVIADLTGRNPNVFYELAIRHVIRRPYVQIIETGEPIPFDVSGVRTIDINYRDLDSADNARKEIIKQIKSIHQDGYEVTTPFSFTLDLDKLRHSENPDKRELADVLTAINGLKSEILSLKAKSLENDFLEKRACFISFKDPLPQTEDKLIKNICFSNLKESDMKSAWQGIIENIKKVNDGCERGADSKSS